MANLGIIIQSIWLLLPAALANMVPILAVKVAPNFNTPIDFGRKWKQKELFGSHKTYRGLIAGVITGFTVFIFQRVLFYYVPFIQDISLINYSEVSSFFGAWMGFGALIGDLIKSFFKRRLDITSGSPWIPFDQIDWIIGALISIRLVYTPNLIFVITSLIVFIILHLLIKYIGFLWKLNPTPF